MSKKNKQKNKSTQCKSKLQNVENLQTVDSIAVEQLTPEQVEEEINELAATHKRERIWEVDFVRGLMILFVVWDHFMWDVYFGFTSSYNTALFQWLYKLGGDYYSGALRNVTHDVFVTLFVLTSGVSCSFSRSNGKRAIKMCAFAVLFSAVTYALSAILQDELTIYFNVIHVVALSVLIYTAIEWIWSKLTKNWQKNIFGVIFFAITMTALIVGHCAKYMNIHWTNLIFGESGWRTAVIKKFYGGGDYLAFLPDFGWFLVGVVLGKALYRERKSIFPSVNPKYVCPVTFCGRYSLWVYFISQVVMYGVIYLLHEVVNVL
ncbi:MAG: DUF1624 domain-containing protein [Clostridiales bacterium]|nr:DUF1624 domain-containing protein [Clostridiales bacterium]